MLYPIAISIGDEEHAWGVEVPDIPGCFSAGDDLDDAVAMAREAIEGHFEILAEDGAPIPAASKLGLHVANPKFAGCAWAVVDIDVVKYLGKAQKLNITLPGHLLNRIDEYVCITRRRRVVRGLASAVEGIAAGLISAEHQIYHHPPLRGHRRIRVITFEGTHCGPFAADNLTQKST